jgi:hypothetical protein
MVRPSARCILGKHNLAHAAVGDGKIALCTEGRRLCHLINAIYHKRCASGDRARLVKKSDEVKRPEYTKALRDLATFLSALDGLHS